MIIMYTRKTILQVLCWETVKLAGGDGRERSLAALSEVQGGVRTRTWRGAERLNPLANFEMVLDKANVSVRPWPRISRGNN